MKFMTNKQNFNLHLAGWCLMAATALVSGCQQNIFEGELTEARDCPISFAVSSNTIGIADLETSSLNPVEMGGLTLYGSVTPTADIIPVATKATPVTGDNLDTYYNDGTLYATAFKEDHSVLAPFQALTFSSRKEGESISIWKTTGSYLWLGQRLTFWSIAPYVDPTTISDDRTSMSFDYTTQKSESSTDAESQKDLLIAYSVSDGSSNTASLQFEHALSALRFEMGNTNGCTIKTIALKNVWSKGTCTYNAAAVSPTQKISWSSLNTAEDYTQTFNKTITERFDGESNTQPVFKTSETADAATFMIIPQSSTADNKITLEIVLRIKDAESDITLTKELSAEETGWNPGLTYTYTISTSDAGEISVSVTDNVSEGKKTDVVISNNGAVREYIRAAIVGNWFKDGVIVAPWTYDAANPSASKFVDLPSDASGSGARWIYNSADGFYYYTAPVAAGSATGTKLFTSFTAPSTTPPVTGACFEMKLMVQGVIYDLGKTRVTTAWGADVAALLSTDN